MAELKQTESGLSIPPPINTYHNIFPAPEVEQSEFCWEADCGKVTKCENCLFYWCNKKEFNNLNVKPDEENN